MSNTPSNHTADRPAAFPWPPVLLLGVVAAALVLQRTYGVAWPGLDDSPARIVGLGFGVIGIGLIVWSVATLYHHKTTVLPTKGADVLVTTGPYRFRRNPIYLAEVLMLLGLAEWTKNIFLVAAALLFAALVTWLAIIPEERHLDARFGKAYRDYVAKTRRWI